MFSQYINRQLGLKISILTTCSLVFVSLIFLLVVGQFEQNFAQGQHLLSFYTLFALFFIFLQAALVFVGVSLFVTRPLNKLMRAMKKVEQGNLLAGCDIQTQDELGELGDCFNEMVKNLDRVQQSRHQIEQRLIKAEESLKYKQELEDKTRIIERMNHELTSVCNDVTLLYSVSQRLNSIMEVDDLVNAVKDIFCEQYKCDAFAFYLMQSRSRQFYLAGHKGLDNNLISPAQEPLQLCGLAQQTVQSKHCFYIDHIKQHADHLSTMETSLGGSLFSVPLVLRNEVIGLIMIWRRQTQGFSPSDRQSLKSISSQIAVAYDRALLYTRTRELSVRDELTGVYNRRHFQQTLKLEIKRAERFKRPISLMMIDVDCFKKFNDTYGHVRGDELLKQLAQLLKEKIREVDLLARFGGEEFVIMLTDTSLSDAVGVANKLQRMVRKHLGISIGSEGTARIGKDSGVTISIGVSSFPECISHPRDLVNTADMALYAAKRDGRDLVRTYCMSSVAAQGLMA